MPTQDTEEIITRLSILAFEFNSGNGIKIQSTDDYIDCKEIVVNKLSVGRLLDHMKNSINNSMGRNEWMEVQQNYKKFNN